MIERDSRTRTRELEGRRSSWCQGGWAAGENHPSPPTCPALGTEQALPFGTSLRCFPGISNNIISLGLTQKN